MEYAGTLVVTRHGERKDYWELRNGNNWITTAERPFDPPLTEEGLFQASKCGKRILELCKTLGKPKPTHAYSSPLLRCIETCSNAAKAIGDITQVKIEHGLVESLTASWYKSWGATEADSTWGGPKHHPPGTIFEDEEMHPLVFVPASSLFHTPDDIESFESISLSIDQRYSSVVFDASPYNWKNLEPKQERMRRLRLTVEALVKNHTNETILVNSHAGPCAHIFEELMGEEPPTNADYTAISIYEYEISPQGKFTWKNLVLNDKEHVKGAVQGI